MCRLHDDEGMTLVEILVASVIMFIILTAVLGLVAQTTAMGMQAKRKTMLTNAVSAYIERVQGLPFEQVGVDSEDASGTLEPLYRYVDPNRAEFTITIDPDVEWDGSAPLKTLSMDVTLTDARGTVVQTMQTSVAIRNRAQYLQQASRDPSTDPRVEFILPTPDEGTVVWEDEWKAGGVTKSLTIGLRAEAQAGRTLESVQVWCDDQWLLAGTSLKARAQWGHSELQPSPWSDIDFTWNTMQEEDVVQPDNSTVSTPIIPDGMRTLSVYALDSAGVSVFAIRHVLVDNYAPGRPGTPVPVVKSAVRTDVAWAEAMDGTTPAYRYRLSIWRIRLDTEPVYGAYPYWTPVDLADPTSAVPSFALDTVPFSRYSVGVRAESPRNLGSPDVAAAQNFTSRPRLSGTYAVTGSAPGTYRTKLTLSVTPPNFMVHAGTTPSYTWNWVAADGSKDKVTTAAPSVVIDIAHASAVQPVSVSVDIQFQPVDRPKSEKLSIRSNLAGPTPTSGSGTLGEGTW